MVDFVLVGALLTLFFVSVVQLTLALHVRNTLIDAASSGARYGALADRSPEDARSRTIDLITMALNGDYAADVVAVEETRDGYGTLEVIVRAPLPVVGLAGPGSIQEVRGHAPRPD